MCIATSVRARCMGCCACAALRRTTRTSSARPNRLRSEVVGCIDLREAVLKTFGFDEFKVELSTWDPNDRKNYAGQRRALEAGDSIRWRRCSTRSEIPYKTIPGEAAFYGPKIDIKLVDVLGRLWQLRRCSSTSTCRQRFELEYVGEDGERHQPVMVHRALFGSVERFFGVLIEHYAGAFPLWLAPVQVGMCRSAKASSIREQGEGRSLKPRDCAWRSMHATRR